MHSILRPRLLLLNTLHGVPSDSSQSPDRKSIGRSPSFKTIACRLSQIYLLRQNNTFGNLIMHLAALTTVTFLFAIASATPRPIGGPVCPGGCPKTQVCAPRSNADQLVGICVTPTGVCGGILGRGCESPRDVCIDDPRDDCDPTKGGSDCIGVCVPRV